MELREIFEAAGCDWEDAKSRISSDELFNKVSADYRQAVNAIEQLKRQG